MKDNLDTFIVSVLLLGFLLIMFMAAYDVFKLYKYVHKVLCKFGIHKMTRKIGGVIKVRTYYCVYCKKPRNHPKLKVVEGDSKLWKNKYKF